MKQELIEKALALTGKTMEDVTIWVGITMDFFSIEKFCYYLLSPEFIEKYFEIYMPDENQRSMITWLFVVWKIAIAIYEYQSGNEKPLEDLLEKICQ